MADIKEYTDQIAGAIYGEEVRGSIINALNKVNDDNNSYAALKEEVIANASAAATSEANAAASQMASASSAEMASASATEAGNAMATAEGYRDEARTYSENAKAVSGVDIATTEKAGLVKPDGDTIQVDGEGMLTAHLDASDVGALKIYTSLSELGLAEATATAEAIAHAMADNSMLLHKLSGTATTATLAFPYNYSLFRVTKLTVSYVSFECVATGNLPTSYSYYNEGASNKWSGWSTRFLPLTGGTVAGHVYVDRGTGAATFNSYRTLSDGSKTRAQFWNGSTKDAEIAVYDADDGTELVRLCIQPDGVYFNNNSGNKRVFGEHNKPTGTYTGNGDATSRTIDTGGIGGVLAIWSNAGMCIITNGGAICKTGTTVSAIPASEVSFANGVLTMKSTNNFVNNASYTYAYQVL